MPTRVAIDGHVHLREARQDTAALRQAAANFARTCPLPDRIGVLMLAESAGEDAYERLAEAAGADREDGLRIVRTDEAESLWVHVDDWRILVVAGRQVVTAERLEVLALATSRRFEDGTALNALLPQIAQVAAVPVVPWGCGKWLGARRAHVHSALLGNGSTPLLLGDNAGRPAVWHDALLSGSRSMRVLRGSDPLPLPGHWRRIGRFGCIVDLELSPRKPAASVRDALRDPSVPLVPFGELQRPAAFLIDQARLRLPGRVRHVPSSSRAVT
ncbi:MAG: hypothetical protein ACXWUM_02685 [Burkholderiaceae bacterium]